MCIFCKIINAEIPSYKLYEDEDVLAFLDISQVTKGHTLVVPKRHYDSILDCDPQDLQRVIAVTQKLGKQLSQTLNCKGMNILSNVNEIAGQSVFHFHVHLIPRYHENDACILKFTESEAQNLEQLQKDILGG